jgi:hypothetical protein
VNLHEASAQSCCMFNLGMDTMYPPFRDSRKHLHIW